MCEEQHQHLRISTQKRKKYVDSKKLIVWSLTKNLIRGTFISSFQFKIVSRKYHRNSITFYYVKIWLLNIETFYSAVNLYFR